MKVVAKGPLTVAKIEALKPRADRYELSDASTGLRLRVTPNGVKSFRWPYHTPAGQRVLTLGRWASTPQPGCLTLSQARDWLERLKESHRVGKLEEVETELLKLTRPKTHAEPEGALTVKQVADAFLVFMERERKRPEQARRPIEFDILPAIGEMPIAAVTVQDGRRIVEAVVARGSPTQAGTVLGILKQLFSFAVGRADLEVSPMDRLTNARALGVVKNVSQRFLSKDEIGPFWRALDDYAGMTPTVRNGLKLLLLTGVRSGELLQARFADIDFEAKTWTVPVANQKGTKAAEKTARPWVVPLGPTAVELLKTLSDLASGLRSPHVMASFHASDRGAPLTDKSLNHAMRRLFEPEETAPLKFEGERPTPHDLRRTVRTGLGDLGTQWHIAERVLNHSLGKIATTYDVGDYLSERRTALEKWDAHVIGLVAKT